MLAKRSSRAEGWIARVLDSRVRDLAEVAVEVAIESGDPIGRILSGFLDRVDDPDRLERLANRVQSNSFGESPALMELGLVLGRQLLERRLSMWSEPDRSQQEELARSWQNLSLRLDQAASSEEALVAASSARRLWAGLHRDQPEIFGIALGDALANEGEILNKLGRHEEALRALDESIELLRTARERHPDATRSALAAAMDIEAAVYHQMGRLEEALALAAQAIEIHQEAPSGDEDYLQHYRMMGNFALILRSTGWLDEALEVARDVVDWGRRLADERPLAFRRDLARSLTNLSLILADAGEVEESLAAEAEAVEILRELVRLRPHAYVTSLIVALANLAMSRRAVGREEEGLAVATEAVELCRQGDFRQLLIPALTNQGILLVDVGRLDEAVGALRESVELCRDAAVSSSVTDLLQALVNLSHALGALARGDEALGAAEEALELWEGLTEAERESNAGLSEVILARVANALYAVGRTGSAVEVARRALVANGLPPDSVEEELRRALERPEGAG